MSEFRPVSVRYNRLKDLGKTIYIIYHLEDGTPIAVGDDVHQLLYIARPRHGDKKFGITVKQD